jgi:methylamine dehydrogenase heavy chain
MAALSSTLALLTAGSAQAELPVETLTTTPLPADTTHRLYIADMAMGHIVDGRLHLLDGRNMRYLGLIGTGFAGSFALTPDGRQIVVATTYHSRLQRGTRTDVVEVYNASDLTFQYEIEIPAKHVQGLMIKPLLAFTPDGRHLLVQNATPATSISIVDLQTRKFITESPNPGCYGLLPWSDGTSRFSSVCGDGTLSTIGIDGTGQPSAPQRSAAFFDPDKDPVYMHFDRLGDRLVLLSYHGTVHQLKLAGDAPSFEAPWNFVTGADRKQGWRPGGLQLFAADAATGRLLVGMHPKAIEGSHKSPATELWSIDLKTKQRVARTPGHTAISMTISSDRLFTLNAVNNTVQAFDLRRPNGLRKPMAVSAPVGESPVYLGLTP